MHGGGLTPDAIRHIILYTLAIQPTLTYGAHTIHLKKTDLQLLEKAHARIIKTCLGLSKFSKTNQPGSNISIEYCKHITHARTQASSHAPVCARTRATACTHPHTHRRWVCAIRREESDGDGCAREKKERKTKAGCLYKINNDMSERELSGDDAQDRTKWRRLIRDIDPT